ncbi:MAG TPA: hypothetical protein PKM27_13545 [Saprospiraceae bacterium]|nr:hypothetical protein [Saprospiraceae bacterium]HNT22241.1 hypothetical protein [Saprospiraceae bacterium]
MKSLHLAIPAILLVVISTILLFTHHRMWSLGLAVGILALVGIYLLKDLIDWKYYLKHPPRLDKPVLGWLERVPFYRQLSEGDKIRFQQRLALFMLAHEYRVQPLAHASDEEEIQAPEDLKAISSIPAVMLLFNQDEYLIENIERIVFYGHPFPSPSIKELHHSEWNEEDKVLIFSIPHLKKGVLEPFGYFDLGLYEWVRAIKTVPLPSYSWEQFEKEFLIHKSQIGLALGIADPDLHAVRKVYELHRSYIQLAPEPPSGALPDRV